MGKKVIEKVLRYNAVFEPCEEGGFSVTVPNLPGLITEGDTYEEALENVRDAVKGYLQVLDQAGEEIPDTDDKTFTTPIDFVAT
jgi:antitoxin HicB